MRFKISIASRTSHSAAVTCVGWSNTEEVYSAGDDNLLLSWSVSTNQSTKIAQLNQDLYPIDMQFVPRADGTVSRHGELVLLTSADGKFYILNRAGRIERSVEAHTGAILVGLWDNDGTGLLTAGEDGFVKVWSRSGMLRSTVVSSDNSVYGACWSPDSQSIAYTQGKCVVIKQLAPNTKPIRWKAHEGLVLCLSWSGSSDQIVSGGEDCRYRVWDSHGRQMYSSSLHDYPITAAAWAPIGDLFAIGSFNTLRLCDYSGWSRSLEKPNTGSIYKLAWSGDGTQLAGACANGHVLFAHLIERDVIYENLIASVTEPNRVMVKDVLNESTDLLELPERIIQLALRYNHLVATTPTQIYIFKTDNWNTPAILDLKDGSLFILLLCKKHMLLVDKTTLGVYNYQGRLVAAIRWTGMRLHHLRPSHLSLSPDTVVVRDTSDIKKVHVMDLNTRGAPEFTVIRHNIPVVQVALNQQGDAGSRTVALLDKARDLYIVQVRSSDKVLFKLSRKIESFQWNATDNSIAVIQEAQLCVWYCPTASFNTKLLKLCSLQYDSPELGRNPRLTDFVGNSVSVRRADGSLLNVPISPFPNLIQRYVLDNDWSDALELCRSINNETVWACLAVLATQSSSDTIDIAEEAYANINHYEKVLYLQYVKLLPAKAEQKAHMALLGGRTHEAESILLHNGMVFQAIYNHTNLHNWSRALDLAIKHKTHIDTVLSMRQKYLDSLGKSENNNKFITLKESIQIDVEKVEQKLRMELQKRKPSQ